METELYIYAKYRNVLQKVGMVQYTAKYIVHLQEGWLPPTKRA